MSCALLYQRRQWLGFVDEDDNFLGGRLIASGWRLYSDYFSHHMPLPYWFVAFLTWLGLDSREGYRLVTFVPIAALWAFALFRFRSVPIVTRMVYVGTIPLAFGHFFGYMLLGQTILGYCLPLLVVYLYASDRLDFHVADQVAIAVLVACCWLSTLISAYPFVVLAAYWGWCRLRRSDAGRPRIDARDVRLALLLVVPVIVFLGWLVITGLLTTWFEDAVSFNLVYYSRFIFESGQLSIVQQITKYHRSLLTLPIHPEYARTAVGWLSISNLVATVVLARRRGPAFGLMFWLLTLACQVRGVGAVEGHPFYTVSLLGVGFAVDAALGRVREQAGWALTLCRPALAWRIGRWSAA